MNRFIFDLYFLITLSVSAFAEFEITLEMAENEATASDHLIIPMPPVSELTPGPFYYYIYSSADMVEWQRSRYTAEVGYSPATGPYFSYVIRLLPDVEYLNDHFSSITVDWDRWSVVYSTRGYTGSFPAQYFPRSESRFYKVERFTEQ